MNGVLADLTDYLSAKLCQWLEAVANSVVAVLASVQLERLFLFTDEVHFNTTHLEAIALLSTGFTLPDSIVGSGSGMWWGICGTK